VKTHALTSLLDKLCSGDEAAAAAAFQEHERLLRIVVRRKLPEALRSKFDSLDVVQSVWADLWQGFREAGWRFQDADHLTAFLVRLTRNRLVDRVRRHHQAMRHERPLEELAPDAAGPSPLPRPSEEAQASETWDRLLALCPPAHHELLRLRRQGLTLAAIAEHTGLHPSSVRRILYDLARRLALKEPLERHDDAPPGPPTA
jgi:RNA polymerase sigma factor (sigma-70 family)